MYTRICYIALKNLVPQTAHRAGTVENTSEFHSHDSFVCGLDRFFLPVKAKRDFVSFVDVDEGGVTRGHRRTS